MFLTDGDHFLPIRATKARVKIDVSLHALEHTADVENQEQW